MRQFHVCKMFSGLIFHNQYQTKGNHPSVCSDTSRHALHVIALYGHTGDYAGPYGSYIAVFDLKCLYQVYHPPLHIYIYKYLFVALYMCKWKLQITHTEMYASCKLEHKMDPFYNGQLWNHMICNDSICVLISEVVISEVTILWDTRQCPS